MSVLPQLSYKIDQMESLFNIPPLKEGKTDFNGNDLQIRFENVRFSYEKDEVLHGISFSVPQGSLTALVGESGSGKSTLAKLLVHFYDVTDGRITLGGQDLREMLLASLNEQISFVARSSSCSTPACWRTSGWEDPAPPSRRCWRRRNGLNAESF